MDTQVLLAQLALGGLNVATSRRKLWWLIRRSDRRRHSRIYFQDPCLSIKMLAEHGGTAPKTSEKDVKRLQKDYPYADGSHVMEVAGVQAPAMP